MEDHRKYQFSWDLLGDIALGRPNLGPSTRLEVYRLLQLCFRDIVEQRLGTEATDEVFRDAGYLAGQFFYKNVLSQSSNLDDFVSSLQTVLKDMGIGVLRMESSDVEKGEFVLTVSEDLDCSGLPETGFQICTYDEGFIAALMESYSGVKFKVREIDCWCTGARTCRFTADAIKDGES
jgi:uncharacterized protein